MTYIPEKIKKIEKRELLVKIIEKLIAHWYTNMELSWLLNVHKNVISWLRIKKVNYPMSLKKVEPLLDLAKTLEEKIEDK